MWRAWTLPLLFSQHKRSWKIENQQLLSDPWENWDHRAPGARAGEGRHRGRPPLEPPSGRSVSGVAGAWAWLPSEIKTCENPPWGPQQSSRWRSEKNPLLLPLKGRRKVTILKFPEHSVLLNKGLHRTEAVLPKYDPQPNQPGEMEEPNSSPISPSCLT